MADKVLEWETLEHPYYEKDGDWYWIIGIAGFTVAFLSLIFNNILLAVLFVIATVTVMLHGSSVPRIIKVRLDGNGVTLGNEYFPYTRIKSFSIDEPEGSGPENPPILCLKIDKMFATHTTIAIEDVASEQVRQTLLDHLNETYHEHSLIDTLIHYLGF